MSAGQTRIELVSSAANVAQMPETKPQAQQPHIAYLSRMVTDGSDEAAWLRARSRGITATDVAKLNSVNAIPTAALENCVARASPGTHTPTMARPANLLSLPG